MLATTLNIILLPFKYIFIYFLSRYSTILLCLFTYDCNMCIVYVGFLSAGSKDGFLRFWKCGQEYRSLTPLFVLPMVSYILWSLLEILCLIRFVAECSDFLTLCYISLWFSLSTITTWRCGFMPTMSLHPVYRVAQKK